MDEGTKGRLSESGTKMKQLEEHFPTNKFDWKMGRSSTISKSCLYTSRNTLLLWCMFFNVKIAKNLKTLITHSAKISVCKGQGQQSICSVCDVCQCHPLYRKEATYEHDLKSPSSSMGQSSFIME